MLCCFGLCGEQIESEKWKKKMHKGRCPNERFYTYCCYDCIFVWKSIIIFLSIPSYAYWLDSLFLSKCVCALEYIFIAYGPELSLNFRTYF